MRILFLNDLSDPRIGSSIRQMYQQGAHLRELGHETALVTAVQDPAEVGETEILGMRVFRVLSDYNVRFRAWIALDNPRVRGPVADVLREFRPDVVHSHLIHTRLGFGSLAAARESCPPTPFRSGGQRVLWIIDDDAAVRGVVRGQAERRGWLVREAACAEEALGAREIDLGEHGSGGLRRGQRGGLGGF